MNIFITYIFICTFIFYIFDCWCNKFAIFFIILICSLNTQNRDVLYIFFVSTWRSCFKLQYSSIPLWNFDNIWYLSIGLLLFMFLRALSYYFVGKTFKSTFCSFSSQIIILSYQRSGIFKWNKFLIFSTHKLKSNVLKCFEHYMWICILVIRFDLFHLFIIWC